jgi:hypothetical protein
MEEGISVILSMVCAFGVSSVTGLGNSKIGLIIRIARLFLTFRL